ncbi:carbohydrate ABC transporter permease [Paenibacillus chungangensis]|uniref:Carbohydrate ABC transporter permease n=1 Tax=Paenibacillus chungangensis TaxID=696535 RepID=A0ABW3HWH7_9BACL
MAVKNLYSILYKLIIIVLTMIYAIPLYVVLVNSFKSLNNIIKSPLSLPYPAIFENFVEAFERSDILRLYWNSIVITGFSVLLLVFCSSMIAFVLARRDGKRSTALYFIILAGLMIPQQLVLIPEIQVLKQLGLINTFAGLIFFNVATYISIGFFLYVEFFKTLPRSLEESAMIDGAGSFTIFFKIYFPLLKSCTATVVIFLGMWIWNDFLPPLYILGGDSGLTITTGIYRAIGQYTTEWNIVFASVFFASVPIIVLYLFMQKQFTKGMIAGAVKG